MVRRVFGFAGAALLALMLWGQGALAEVVGGPQPWELNLQPAYSPVKERIHDFHDVLLILTSAIVVFVMVLLAIVILRFNAKRNPVPSRNSHNTLIEIVWTVVPALILLTMFVPSMRLLYFLDKAHQADMTIKVTGHQWYWSYQYPDHQDLTFDSYMTAESDLKPGQPRLLTVDNQLVVPAGKTIRVLVTSGDVLHSWLVPPFGVQIYAVPGRINETWFKAEVPGTFYGQCNQICGVNHGFMPIAIRAVPEQEFTAWVGEAKKKFATNTDAPSALAAR